MIEYAQAKVRMNNLTTLTIVNLNERVGTMSLIEMESTMQINLVCMTNIPNTPTSNECNSSIGFFSLRASNMGRELI